MTEGLRHWDTVQFDPEGTVGQVSFNWYALCQDEECDDSVRLLSELREVEGLQVIELRGSGPRNTRKYLWEQEAAVLARLPQLKALRVQYTGRSALEQLHHAAKLESLEVWAPSSELSAAFGILSLRSLSVFVNDGFGEAPVEDESLTNIGHLTQLEHLSIRAASISEGALLEIGNLSQLRRLELSNCEWTAASVKAVASLPELRCLELHGCRGSAELFAALAGRRHLKKLHLGYVTDEELLGISRIPSLSILTIDRGSTTEDGFSALQNLPSLRLLFYGVGEHTNHPPSQVVRQLLPDCRVIQQ